MTRREWMEQHHPDRVGLGFTGQVANCPYSYPDLPDPRKDALRKKGCANIASCAECWNTEMSPLETVRLKTIQAAIDCVCKERNDQYGEPEESFSTIAELWTAYFGHEYTAHDVAMALALLKVGRIAKGQRKVDNYIDLAGYAACAAEIADEEEASANGKT